MENNKLVKCPDCFGDGIETCHNPDHGFLANFLGPVVGANESACPCCGHSEDHKMKTYNMKTSRYDNNQCCTCIGNGKLTLEQYNNYLDNEVDIKDIDDINEVCLK